MKYMNMRNSCFFAALANLLDSYNVDVEDVDIIRDSLIPYLFYYDEGTKWYHAGYLIQHRHIINQYLKQFHVSFKEYVLEEETVLMNKYKLIDFIQDKTNCIVSLKIGNNPTSHATIFKGVKGKTYQFLNMKQETSHEPTIVSYTKEELINVLSDHSRVGWLEPVITGHDMDIQKTLIESLSVVSMLEREILNTLKTKVSYEQRMIERETMFRAIFLAYKDIASLMKQESLYQSIVLLLQSYMTTFSLPEAIYLNDYIDEIMMKQVFFEIKTQIQRKIQTIE